MYARQCANHVTYFTPFNSSMGCALLPLILWSSQKVNNYSRSQISPMAELEFQFMVGCLPNQGCLTWTNTSSGSLWKEFRNSMSLDGKKITCLFSFQLKLNIFINYECSQPQRYLQYPWILTPIKITVVFLSQFSFCRYLKIAFTYHY